MKAASQLPAVIIETGPNPIACVIWLHGLGADGHDFEPIVPYLGVPDTLPIRYIFPHAPKRPVTLNGGMIMRAWYDIESIDAIRDEDRAGIAGSAALIEGMIAGAKAEGFASRQIVITGFSQGGAMAYHVGLRHAEPLAGIVVLSAYLLLEDDLEREASPASREVPILQCHGTWDPVVPLALGQHSAEFLRARGFQVQWKTYAAQHSLHPEEVTEIGRFLTACLTRGQSPA